MFSPPFQCPLAACAALPLVKWEGVLRLLVLRARPRDDDAVLAAFARRLRFRLLLRDPRRRVGARTVSAHRAATAVEAHHDFALPLGALPQRLALRVLCGLEVVGISHRLAAAVHRDGAMRALRL